MAIDAQAMIADDHKYVDGTETVTVIQPDNLTGGFTVTDARRANRVIQSLDAGGGVVIGSGMVFYLWIDACDERPLKSAQLIDSAGVKYRVEESRVTTMRTRYDVDVVKEPGQPPDRGV